MDSHRKNVNEETILNEMKKIYNRRNIKKKYDRVTWGLVSHYYYSVTRPPADIVPICDMAAYNGHLEILKWAHSNGSHWNGHTLCYAAKEGHLEILKYAHSNGCPQDKYVCYYAALNGHLDILYYLYENEWPYYPCRDVHKNCRDFFDTYGEHWEKGEFVFNYLKPAKS